MIIGEWQNKIISSQFKKYTSFTCFFAISPLLLTCFSYQSELNLVVFWGMSDCKSETHHDGVQIFESLNLG